MSLISSLRGSAGLCGDPSVSTAGLVAGNKSFQEARRGVLVRFVPSGPKDARSLLVLLPQFVRLAGLPCSRMVCIYSIQVSSVNPRSAPIGAEMMQPTCSVAWFEPILSMTSLAFSVQYFNN